MRLTYAIKYVADMEQPIAFYRDKLGLELKFESPFWTEFSTGETVLALHPASEENRRRRGRTRLRCRRSRRILRAARGTRDRIHPRAQGDARHPHRRHPGRRRRERIGERPHLSVERCLPHCSTGCNVARDGRRILPHPAPAALRLRRGERDEGRGARSGRGHRRSRHGQPRRRRRRSTSSTSSREVANKPHAHRYSASRGIPGLRKAQAAYYQRRFGVTLDPDKEVIVTLGSKEGLANLAQAITAPGDVVLAPNPSYPIHSFGFIIAGAAIRSIPAAPGEDFFDRLDQRDALHRAAAQGAGDRLSVEPDRLCRRPRFLRTPRRLRARA